MNTRLIFTVITSVLAASAGHAAQFVQNGSFSTDSLGTAHEFGASHDGQTVANWTSASANAFNLWFPNATAAVGGVGHNTDADTRFGEHGQFLWTMPANADPDGGAFIALDGDGGYNGAITQMITGLTVGQTYHLSFDWASGQFEDRSGATTEQITYSLGGQSFTTNVVNTPSHGATNWQVVTHDFTATGNSELLSFLSSGTPSGLPPVALLDGVSLTGGVPEPETWAMMLIGFTTIGALLRRKRAVAAS